MADLRQFDRVAAIYRPLRTDDLVIGAIACAGHVGVWEALWVIEEEDNASYAGMWAMRPDDTAKWPFGWVPECDLEIIPEGCEHERRNDHGDACLDCGAVYLAGEGWQ